ncbi:hypothetical protein ABZX99_18645 [Streptomyces antibioticus]|uniref:hypothetical protein n=1 Tax=Streptomyces antibioticus TaxID=1890 RepID=UPI0033AA77EA
MSNLKVSRVRGKEVTEVQGVAMGAEVELQRLIEANMEAMLGIRFLATERHTRRHGGRVATAVGIRLSRSWGGALRND